MSHCFDSACHCGALRLAFMTDVAPSQWRVRACQCAFCRAHGARTTSDSAGSVRFTILDSAALVEYRFGLRTAEFLLCARCGVYIAAMVTTPRGRFATINVNALRDVADIAGAQKVTYDGETAKQRLARREGGWTPVLANV